MGISEATLIEADANRIEQLDKNKANEKDDEEQFSDSLDVSSINRRKTIEREKLDKNVIINCTSERDQVLMKLECLSEELSTSQENCKAQSKHCLALQYRIDELTSALGTCEEAERRREECINELQKCLKDVKSESQCLKEEKCKLESQLSEVMCGNETLSCRIVEYQEQIRNLEGKLKEDKSNCHLEPLTNDLCFNNCAAKKDSIVAVVCCEEVTCSKLNIAADCDSLSLSDSSSRSCNDVACREMEVKENINESADRRIRELESELTKSRLMLDDMTKQFKKVLIELNDANDKLNGNRKCWWWFC